MFSRFKSYALKITGSISAVIRYACVTYCITEYIGDISIVSSLASFIIILQTLVLCNSIHYISLQCSGPSMQPTLYTNDIVLSEHISRRNYRFDYGDIVVSKSPSNPKEYICKRITGLPGDKMKLNYLSYQYVSNSNCFNFLLE